MRALTVQQPWAWAIVHGGKDVENRTQAWSYRGPLAIHAGARRSQPGADRVPGLVAADCLLMGADLVRQVMDAESAVRGAIIGVVDLVDVHQAEHDVELAERGRIVCTCCESRWAEASYDEHGGRTRRDVVHLVLENPRPLADPIPCPGRLGLWTPPVEVTAAVELNLGVDDWLDEVLGGDR